MRCLQLRSDQQWEKEIPLEPPRKIRGRTRRFQLLESRANRGPTEGPRSPKLETRHHMRTSNERLDREVGTPYRDRRPGEPGTEATRRRRRQKKPSKQHQKGLILHLKQKGTAESPLRMQKQPQLPYSMTAPSDYRRKWGSSTPHRERSYCSNTSETTGGWETATVPTPSRISRLARQPLSPYRERTEERSDRISDR